MKSYREALLNSVPPGQRKTRDLVFFHGVHTLSALIQKLEGHSPVPSPVEPAAVNPKIDGVATEGNGLTAVFIVRGSNFLAGKTVVIRIARIGEDQIHNVFFDTTAKPDGSMERRIPIPCMSGLQFSFSANDGRSDASDITGTLWSNTFTVSCP